MGRNNLTNRIGETNVNKQGDTMKIIEYNSARNIKVLFSTGEIVTSMYGEFKTGSIVSHFYPSVCGVGILGKHEEKIDRRTYDYWCSMIKRCYDDNFHKKSPTYKDCSVCDEWIYFDNFKKWFDENYYEVEDEVMCLDKDILIKGNKVYSPDTCIFVPRHINSLFVKNDTSRNGLPIGVQYNATKTRYVALAKDGGRNMKRLGTYDTPEEAFYSYKEFKENRIREIANKYRSKIPEKLYFGMINYSFEITD